MVVAVAAPANATASVADVAASFVASPTDVALLLPLPLLLLRPLLLLLLLALMLLLMLLMRDAKCFSSSY